MMRLKIVVKDWKHAVLIPGVNRDKWAARDKRTENCWICNPQTGRKFSLRACWRVNLWIMSCWKYQALEVEFIVKRCKLNLNWTWICSSWGVSCKFSIRVWYKFSISLLCKALSFTIVILTVSDIDTEKMFAQYYFTNYYYK